MAQDQQAATKTSRCAHGLAFWCYKHIGKPSSPCKILLPQSTSEVEDKIERQQGRRRNRTLTKSVREFARPTTITSRAASYKLSDMINLGAGEHRRQKQIANRTTRTTNARLHALLLRPALRAQYLPPLGRYLRRSPATDSFLPTYLPACPPRAGFAPVCPLPEQERLKKKYK